MKELNLKEKIAQMFLIELQEKEITDATLDMIRKYKIGGIILFRRNYSSYEEMKNLINKLKEANRDNPIPLFISIDQEGGRVNRMPPEIERIKNARAIAQTGDTELVKESSAIISKLLLNMGINLNYAPVLDIKRFEDTHAIGNRSYGENKEDVIKYGIEFMKEMKRQGVITAAKHFPGHGATVKDSHYILPVVKKSKEELEKDDMVPFQKAIEEGTDAIMMGHIIIRDIDWRNPASLSRILIQRHLRRKYNYRGLIITDDLKMLAIRLKYTKKKAVTLAINAGNNMVMLGYKYSEIIKLIDEIARQIKSGKIRESKINNSVKKIIETKKKYNVNDEEIKGLDIESINKEIKQLNDSVIYKTNNHEKNKRT